MVLTCTQNRKGQAGERDMRQEEKSKTKTTQRQSKNRCRRKGEEIENLTKDRKNENQYGRENLSFNFNRTYTEK